MTLIHLLSLIASNLSIRSNLVHSFNNQLSLSFIKDYLYMSIFLWMESWPTWVAKLEDIGEYVIREFCEFLVEEGCFDISNGVYG